MKTNYSMEKRSANGYEMLGRSALILCYLFTTILSFAQTDIQSITLPEGLQMEEYHSMKVFSDELYFVASDGSNGIYDALFKYDGVTVSQISLPADTRVVDESAMQVYGGDLYLVLEDGVSGIYGVLYKYNGSTFTQVVLPDGFKINERTDMVVYDNELYLVLENGSNGIYGALYKYDGADIIEVSLPENYAVDYPSDMVVYNQSLFLVLEGQNDGLYEFDGSSFSHIVMPETYGFDSDGSFLSVFKDELYFAIGDGVVGIRGLLHKYDGETVTQALPSNYEVQEEYGMEVYAGQIYMVIEDDGYGEYYRFDGTNVVKVDLGENLEMEEGYDWAVFMGKLYGVFSDYDQSIYSGLFALTANLDDIPPIEAGNCGRNILEFEDGAYAHIGTITDFNYASGTFEAWVKKDRWTDGYDDALFSNGIGFSSENSFYISFHNGVGLHFRYGGQSDAGNLAAYASTTSTDTLADGSWHHIAATWFNDGNETQLVTYIDGIEIANQFSSENILLTGNPEFGIGEGVVNFLTDFDGGAMSEIRLWDIAKTQEEIVSAKDLLMTGLESGLIAYWPFNDAQGSTTAANLVRPDEEATLVDFTDISNAWVNYPLEIRADGDLVLKNGTVDFGVVPINGSSDIVFTITNNGFKPMDLVGSPITALVGDTDQFTIDLSETLNRLEKGESTTFTISFQPTELVQKSASFSLSNFEICSDVYEVNLTGAGLNDDCASATELTVYAKGEGDYTVGSTEFAGSFEGNLGCVDAGKANDVWYKFTIGSTGSVEIDIDPGTAPYVSGTYYLDCSGEALICLPSVVPEKLYLPIAPGTEVYLQLWSSAADAGTFSIRINEAPNTWAYVGLDPGWSAGSAPQPTDDALILAGYSTENGSLEVNDLELFYDGFIYEGALHVLNNSSVKINGDLINNGGVFVESGGSLVTYGDVSTVDFEELDEWEFNGILIERSTTFDETKGKYSIVGAPVEQASFSDLGTNALVYAYDESVAYNPSGNAGLDRFRTPTQLELLGMEPGVGYFSAFTGDEDGLVYFQGTPNHGLVEVALTYTDQGITEEEVFEGFNLVSNPYPAALSFASFIDVNSSLDMEETIYLWDDYGSDSERGNNADYLMVNASLGTTNSRAEGEEKWDGYIRSCQGFFVKANSTGQILQFTDGMKSVGNNSDDGFFRKQSVTRYKLAITDGTVKKAAIVGYVSDATLGKDKAYDAMIFGQAGLQLYSLQVEGDTKLGIQGVPASYSGDVQIGFNTDTATMHALSLMNLQEVTQSVWLVDTYLNKQVDLTEESYRFTTESGQFNDRFVMRTASALAVTTNRPLIYAHDKILTIETNRSQPAAYRLFDLSGHEVLMAVVTGPAVIDLDHLSNGVYIVSDGIESKKIIIK